MFPRPRVPSSARGEDPGGIELTLTRIAPLLPLAALAMACGRSAAAVRTPVAFPPPSVDSAPVVVHQRPADTVTVTSTEVTRQAVAVFGDSVGVRPDSIAADSVAVDSAAVDELTWDIDVRSYETHAR